MANKNDSLPLNHFAAETAVKSSCGFICTFFSSPFKCSLCMIDLYNVNSLPKQHKKIRSHYAQLHKDQKREVNHEQ